MSTEPGGTQGNEPVLRMRDIVTRFGKQVVHDGISFDVQRGEVLALVGGSGSGKTTLLREMLQLQLPTSGSIELFGHDLTSIEDGEQRALKRRIGVLFQRGALFGSLSVLDNVALPLREHSSLGPDLIAQIATLKIGLVGLPADAAAKMPSQLSGGMIKRAGLARALALDPELLMLDEPSSGLDPVSARALDRLILELREALGLTVLIVTHDLDSIRIVADRVVMLGKGKLLAVGSVDELLRSEERVVREYFNAGQAELAARGEEGRDHPGHKGA
ncbi:MAG: ATP-binding cassette domain-containing protein [Candidatus Eisenbacteria bacterium]|nr:ATP-binding cassette domain-containing protein [Candidatus Eisenbacteria bacterium]